LEVASPPPLPDFVRGVEESITVRSPAFDPGARIPSRYTCEGDDVSPRLEISGVPGNAGSLVLIVYDPDAPIGWFTHWILYDIPPTTKSIREGAGVRGRGVIEGLGLQGLNDFGFIGYGGPCPPRGHGVHRYVFLVLALRDKSIGLSAGAGFRQVAERVRGRILAYGYTYGTYSR